MAILLGLGCIALGVRERWPELYPGLVLQAMAPPLMAAPALAAFMGLDATLVLCTMVLSTALVPLTAPLFAHALLGSSLAISSLALGLRLLALLAGSALVGIAIRRFAGVPRIERHKENIDGLNILAMFVFVPAMMESVALQFAAAPLLTAELVVISFGVTFAVLCLTILVFVPVGRHRALALGFTSAQRNTGLMLAATAGVLPDVSWLYFAFTYFPLYFLPLLLHPITRRIAGKA